MLKKSVVINGKRFQVSHMRNSKKGAEVVGGRFHVKGLGTVYIQIYEAAPIDQADVRAHLEQPVPKAPPPEKRNPQRAADQVDEMIVETLRAMAKRMDQIEARSIVLPIGTVLPPRPSIDGH